MSAAYAGLWRSLGVDLERANAQAGGFMGARRLGVLRRVSLFFTPPIICCVLYRISHTLHRRGRRSLAQSVARFNYLLGKVAIAPGSEIGPGLYLPHTVGVVFQGHAGRGLTLFARAAVMPGVMRDWCGEVPDDAPRLGDDVTVGVASLVRGPLTVASGTLVVARTVQAGPGPAPAAVAARRSPGGSAPRVSIVIVNWKVRELLSECLRSIAAGTRLPSSDYEIIVVDNASADGTIEMLEREFPAVTAVANRDNVGFARANNDALAHCHGRCLLLLNPDTVVSDGAIDHLLEYMESHAAVGALGCRLVYPDGSFQRWTGGAMPTLWNAACHFLFLGRILPVALAGPGLFLQRDIGGDLEVDWVSGACMALRRDALGDRIFDPTIFMYGEDVELCDRLRRDGYSVVYSPSVTIVHHHGSSMRQQSGPVTMSGLKGLRAHYAAHHDRLELWCYDAITALGFSLRSILYAMLAVARPGRGYRERAASSRKYLAQSLRIMTGE